MTVMKALVPSVPDLIRVARTRAGLTQAQLADVSGIATPEISRYENGHRTPSLESLDRLARAMGISTLELLGASSEPGERPSADVESLVALLRGRPPAFQRAVLGMARVLSLELDPSRPA